MSNRKSLFLAFCYYYPPIHSIATLRNVMICKLFSQLTFSTNVYSTSNYQYFPQSEVGDDLPLADYVQTFDYRTISSVRKRDGMHFEESTKESKVGQFFVKWLNSFPFNIIVGEGGLWYSLKLIKKARKEISKHDDVVLFSSFRPYSDHFAAYLIKRKNPNVYWIADFRDVHIDPLKQNVFLKRFQKWCNRKILHAANCVTTVSKGTADHLVDYNDNVYVMPNGIHALSKDREQAKDYEKFTISYTGSLYGDMRDPSLIFQAVQNLIQKKVVEPDKILIRYAGKDKAKWQEYVDKFGGIKFVETEGLISVKEARKIQQRSHINLLLTFSHPEIKGALTGKLFEYISEQKPIIALINGVEDLEIEKLIASVQAGIVVYNEERFLNEIESYILSLYQEWIKTGRSKSLNNDQKIAKYQWSHIFDQFIQENSIKKFL